MTVAIVFAGRCGIVDGMKRGVAEVFRHHRVLLVLVVLALVLRLYKISSPPLDWHAFRQADTASVTREFVKNGINVLVPQYHDLSNIQSGRDNLAGYRMVEFPLVNAVVAWLVRTLGVPLITTSRLVSVLFSLGTLLCLYELVRHVSGRRTAALSALFFAVMPYSVFYSRAILPEPAMVFCIQASLLTFWLWLRSRRWGWYFVSIAALTLALLLKPSAAFLFPVYGGLVVFHEMSVKQRTIQQAVRRVLFYVATMLPALGIAIGALAWWRQWIAQFPSGIPAMDWLFNSNGIRLRPAWFRWLFWERLTKLMVGYIGIALMALNVVHWSRDLLVYASWAIGVLVYFVVIATGNVQHDYYQVLAVPLVCIALGRGASVMWRLLEQRFSLPVAVGSIAMLIAAGSVFAWRQVRGYYHINHPEYITAGQAVDRLTPANALVIAPAFGDTQFLFQTNRRGWPIGFEIEDKIAKGAQYYVTTSYDDEARALEQRYHVMEKNDTFILIDLQRPAGQ